MTCQTQTLLIKEFIFLGDGKLLGVTPTLLRTIPLPQTQPLSLIEILLPSPENRQKTRNFSYLVDSSHLMTPF
jgi:hypothetical protein